jgi:hypothetical protein
MVISISSTTFRIHPGKLEQKLTFALGFPVRARPGGHTIAGFEQVVAGPCVTFVDNRFDYGEERLITLGLLAGRAVIIAHAPLKLPLIVEGCRQGRSSD